MRQHSIQNKQQNALCIEMTRRRALSLVIGICVGLEILFVLLDASTNLKEWGISGPIKRLFNIAMETTIPAWFSVMQAAVVGCIAGLIAWVKRDWRNENRRGWMGWLAIALFFVYMSLDDGSMLHERVGSALRSDSAISNTADDLGEPGGAYKIAPSFPSYSWQLVLMPFFAIFGLYMFLFLWQELGPGEFKWLVAGLACYAVAVGLDFIEGFDHNGNVWNMYPGMAKMCGLDPPTVRHLLQSLEEFLEMLGTTAFLGLFLNHLMLSTGEIRISFRQ